MAATQLAARPSRLYQPIPHLVLAQFAHRRADYRRNVRRVVYWIENLRQIRDRIPVGMLAEATGLSTSTVRRILRDLERHGCYDLDRADGESYVFTLPGDFDHTQGYEPVTHEEASALPFEPGSSEYRCWLRKWGYRANPASCARHRWGRRSHARRRPSTSRGGSVHLEPAPPYRSDKPSDLETFSSEVGATGGIGGREASDEQTRYVEMYRRPDWQGPTAETVDAMIWQIGRAEAISAALKVDWYGQTRQMSKEQKVRTAYGIARCYTTGCRTACRWGCGHAQRSADYHTVKHHTRPLYDPEPAYPDPVIDDSTLPVIVEEELPRRWRRYAKNCRRHDHERGSPTVGVSGGASACSSEQGAGGSIPFGEPLKPFGPGVSRPGGGVAVQHS